MPTDIDAPRGGRAEIMRSTDGGKTWSRPRVLIDTPWDDRAPNFCQLKDGTILCSFFTYPGPSATDLARDPARTTLTGIIRSFDNGRTWEQEPKRLPVPFLFDATDGPIIELQDGSALICVYGRTMEARHDMVAFCRSTDRGTTWELLSTLATDHEMSETAVAQLADGRLVLIARPEGDIAWSSDIGRTWTKPVPLGVRLFEPRLDLPAGRHAALPSRLLRCGGSAGDAQHGRRPDVALSRSRSGAFRSTRRSMVMVRPSNWPTAPCGPPTSTRGAMRRRTRRPKPSGRSGCGCDPATTASTCSPRRGPVPEFHAGQTNMSYDPIREPSAQAGSELRRVTGPPERSELRPPLPRLSTWHQGSPSEIHGEGQARCKRRHKRSGFAHGRAS